MGSPEFRKVRPPRSQTSGEPKKRSKLPVRSFTPTGRDLATYSPDDLLSLQRLAGNQTVTAWLANRDVKAGTGLAIQRYEAYEHAIAGDRARGSQTVKINGVDLTSGEINALGDLYGSLDALRDADQKELLDLRSLIWKQKVNPQSVTEADWDRASNHRYMQLNLHNSAHFGAQNAALVAPQTGTPSGVDNRTTFIKYHTEALVWASRANLPTTPDRQRFLDNAMIANSFSEHFLMDAFSAGHLFNKDDVLAMIQSNLRALTKADLSGVFNDVAGKVYPAKSGFISHYEAQGPWYTVWSWFRLDSIGMFKKLLEGIYETDEGKDAVYSAIVKAAHDRLSNNEAGGGEIGVPVKNDFEPWVLSGDKTLEKSKDTQRWITKALEQARENVLAVANKASTETDAERINKVLAYFPRPTAASAAMIKALIKRVVNPKDGMVDAIAEVIQRELPSLFDSIEAKGYVRKARTFRNGALVSETTIEA